MRCCCGRYLERGRSSSRVGVVMLVKRITDSTAQRVRVEERAPGEKRRRGVLWGAGME